MHDRDSILKLWSLEIVFKKVAANKVFRNFSPVLTWAELSAAFAPGVKRLLNRDVNDKCRHCFLKSRGLCQGFCLSYKYNPDENF